MRLSNRKLKGYFIHGRKLLQPSPPSSASSRHSSWQPDIAIIVSVLLCVIILVVIFASVLRRGLLRRSRRMVNGSGDDVAKRGMEKEALDVLPTIVYREGLELPVMEAGCPICLAEFQQGEELRVLPTCNHGFHVRCIDTWLLSNSSCPSCRHHLVTGKKKISVKPREITTFLP